MERETRWDTRLQLQALKARERLSPEVNGMIPQIARSMNWRALGSPSSPRWPNRLLDHVKATDASYAVLGSLNGDDIMALAFLVVMEAAKSARGDLKDIMKGVKEINDERSATRGMLEYFGDRSEGRVGRWPPW
jgi:hypothetical protein